MHQRFATRYCNVGQKRRNLVIYKCLCCTADHLLGEQSDAGSFIEPDDMDTGFELYLAPDYGPQDDTFYTV